MLTDFSAASESLLFPIDEDAVGAPDTASRRPPAQRPSVDIRPAASAKRRSMTWRGMGAELVEASTGIPVELRFRAPVHLLVIYEQGARRSGETYVEGLPSSALRDVTRKMTFVPAGHDYRETLEPRSATRLLYFYFDATFLRLKTDWNDGDPSLAPRLYFEDTTLWDTALKLKRLIQNPLEEDPRYLEAVGAVLVHELVRLNRGASLPAPLARGGLAAWQQRVVTAYIEEHLAEPIPLAKLAELVHLSPYHFCRTFKQSFGMPPHRYHTSRRIERAKALLARPAFSVTDIGLTVGFSETSSFTAAFRKATGLTPTAYHRSVA